MTDTVEYWRTMAKGYMVERDEARNSSATTLAALQAMVAAEDMPCDLKDPASNGAYFAAYAEALTSARAAIAKATGK